MLFGMNVKQDRSVFARRRVELWAALEQEFPELDKGCIIIPASFETSHCQFRQDSSFYYLTGIEEPACVLMIQKEGHSTLFVPHYGVSRSLWVSSKLEELVEDPSAFEFDAVQYLGEQITGYQAHAWLPEQTYSELADALKKMGAQGKTVFAVKPSANSGSDAQLVIEKLLKIIPGLAEGVQDISHVIARMRRKKDMGEIELMYQAVEMTVLAQEAAARAIAPDVLECEVQGQIDYIFTASGARTAFPTIVASGKNSTILHYTVNCAQLKSDDLVIVDCGADVDHYCGDLSRTYPVSGRFTKRQREIYSIVLDLQEYIASTVKAGFWINNADNPELSLNHLAKAFLAKKGLDQYLVHGISHFLGLDVHDVGNLNEPLADGDMITIEPGLYIPEENIGIRIEDDYWITKNGAICLSEALPKKLDDVEAFMKGKISTCSENEDEVQG